MTQPLPTKEPSASSILVIDDEPELRRIYVRALRSEGYDVHEANNGHEASRFLDQRSFDLVITDILMPDMDGFETINRIRQAKLNMPVLVVSGVTKVFDLDYLTMSRRLGATAALAKPVRVAELLEAVRNLLNSPPTDDGAVPKQVGASST
jgi:CheY-like chemotaxis protein